jgi:hypothetical protein
VAMRAFLQRLNTSEFMGCSARWHHPSSGVGDSAPLPHTLARKALLKAQEGTP